MRRRDIFERVKRDSRTPVISVSVGAGRHDAPHPAGWSCALVVGWARWVVHGSTARTYALAIGWGYETEMPLRPWPQFIRKAGRWEICVCGLFLSYGGREVG